MDTIAPNVECSVVERTTYSHVFCLCAQFRCVDCTLELCRACRKSSVPVLRYFLGPRCRHASKMNMWGVLDQGML